MFFVSLFTVFDSSDHTESRMVSCVVVDPQQPLFMTIEELVEEDNEPLEKRIKHEAM